MDEIRINKRKNMLFTAAAMILPLILSYVINSIHFKMADPTSENYVVLAMCFSAIQTVVMFAVRFIIGKALTGDNGKATVFVGAVYFAANLVSILSSLVSDTVNIIMRIGTVSASNCSYIILISNIVFTLITVFPACYIYTYLEKITFSQEYENISDYLPRAKTFAVICIIVSSVLSTLVSDGTEYLLAVNSVASYSVELAVTVNQISNWLGKIIPTLLVCLFGYKMCNGKWNIFVFGSAVAFAGSVSGVVTSVLSVAIYAVKSSAEILDNYYLTSLTSSYGVFQNIISVIVRIAAVLIVLKFFYKCRNKELHEDLIG